MKKLLLTGRTGFIGRNILATLEESFDVIAPVRQDVDLLDDSAVVHYLNREQFDLVLHCANPNPVKNPTSDGKIDMLEGSLRLFMNFYQHQDLFGKMIFLGSGAEFDKSLDMVQIEEGDLGRSIPRDGYGFAKFIMTSLARQSSNIYNARVFACFGPYDHASKFITHVIRCCLRQQPITIRQDCYFDYIYVSDLGKILVRLLQMNLKHHDYNVCSGQRNALRTIAEIICDQMGYDRGKIVVNHAGWNKEYTGSNERFMQENPDFTYLPLEEGISRQIAWEKDHQSLWK